MPINEIWRGALNTVNDLESKDTTYLPKLQIVFVSETNLWYAYFPNSTNTADGKNVITASGTGRWIAVNNEGFVTVDDINTEPQSAPSRINEILFFSNDGDFYISTGTSSVSDWTIVPTRSIIFGNNTPSALNLFPDFVNQIFINSGNGDLYVSWDGSTWTKFVIKDTTKTTSTVNTGFPSSNPIKVGDIYFDSDTGEAYFAPNNSSYQKINGTEKTKLIIDVSNKSNYSNFNDVVDPVDFQVYFIPPFVNVGTYDLLRYGDARTSSANQIAYLNNTVELNTNYDFSNFINTNGIGWYIFIPTQFNDPTHITNGEVTSLNVGLEFTSITNSAAAKIYNFTESTVGTESVKLGTTTLTGNIQALYVNAMNFQATLKIVPYENLTNGALK